jgi:hypothetical protein
VTPDRAFTARATSTFGLDRLYRVYLSGNQPGQYLGYLIVAIGTAGLLGVNIWYGGPLDPRGD